MAYIETESEKRTGSCIFCDFPRENDDHKHLIPFRSEKCFVILNKFPYNNGHVMIVPYQHTGDLLELGDDVLHDVNKTIQKTVTVLRKTMNPHAMNIGMNLGRSAGAGIDQHLHYHIVPRWDGDTNFMPVISGTKVISESLTATWTKLKKEFERLYRG